MTRTFLHRFEPATATPITGATVDSDPLRVGIQARTATSRRYFGVLFYLEDLFGHSVDLVTEKALRAELRPHIEREALGV